MKLSRHVSLTVVVSVLLSVTACAAYAQAPAPPTPPDAVGTPTVYNVTFLKFELKRTDGTYVTISDTPRTVDIASVGAGIVVDQLTDQPIPVGTYNAFRATISTTFGMELEVNYGGLRVTDGTPAPLMSDLASMVSGPAGSALETDVTIPGAGSSFTMEQAFAGDVTIGKGDSYGTVDVKIDVTDSGGLWVIGPGPDYGGCVTQPSIAITP